MNRIRYRLRYYLKRAYRLIGICYACRCRLNFTRSGAGICPACGLRH